MLSGPLRSVSKFTLALFSAPPVDETIQFLVRNGYAVLFIWVGAEQIGVPVPAAPLLLAAGALAGTGQMKFPLALALAVSASLVSDGIWYELGHHRGSRVLRLLCRISLEPDSCVRQTEDVFGRYGARSLLVAKFLPGLNTAAPPLAGVIGMPLSRFLVFDSLGALLWAGSFMGLGYLFSNQLAQVASYALRLGTWLVVIILGSLSGYIAWKYVERQRFLRQLRVARITPEELKQMLDRDEGPVIVDLRHSLDFAAEPSMIPRAVRFDLKELDHRHQEIPRDRDIVLYCT